MTVLNAKVIKLTCLQAMAQRLESILSMIHSAIQDLVKFYI
jgi:hypothetical protein